MRSVVGYVFGPLVAFRSPRVWSMLLDGLVSVLVWALALGLVGAKDNGGAAALTLVVICVASYVLCTGLAGWTVGKLAVGHRVVNLADGGKPGVPRAALRLLTGLVPLAAGQIPFLPGRDMRFLAGSLRNRVSGTAVVETELARALPLLQPEARRAALIQLASGREEIDADPDHAEPVLAENKWVARRWLFVGLYFPTALCCWAIGYVAGVKNGTTGSLVAGYGGGLVATVVILVLLTRRSSTALRAT